VGYTAGSAHAKGSIRTHIYILYFFPLTNAEVFLVHGLVGWPLDVPKSISLGPAAVEYRRVWFKWLIRVSVLSK
jgi:hypothetical protein